MMATFAVGRIRSLAGCLRFRRMMSSSSRMPPSNLGRNVVSSEEKADNVSPWLMLEPRDDTYRFYSLEERKVMTFDEIANELSGMSTVFIGSSYGWLASFNRHTDCVYLSDPVRRRQVYELPADNIPVLHDGPMLYPRLNIISCSSSDDECRLLMTSHPHARLAFCAPARSSDWSFIDDDDDDDDRKLKLKKKYQSFVYSKTRKAFFCITEVTDEDGGVRSALESWDLSDPDSPKKIDWGFHSLFDFQYSWPARSEEESKLKKLVCLRYRHLLMDEASDQLFLVVRHVIPHYRPDYSLHPKVYHSPNRPKKFHNTLDFDVFKIDLERKLVTHMADSLDGLAFFVGVAHYVVRPTGTSRLKPNSIYFTDLPELCYVYKGTRDGYDGGTYADDGVFDYESRAFSSLAHIIHSHPRPTDFQQQILVQHMLSERVDLWYTPIG